MFITINTKPQYCLPPPSSGAGNQVAVVLMDVLHMLIMEDAVVLLKLNPVNE